MMWSFASLHNATLIWNTNSIISILFIVCNDRPKNRVDSIRKPGLTRVIPYIYQDIGNQLSTNFDVGRVSQLAYYFSSCIIHEVGTYKRASNKLLLQELHKAVIRPQVLAPLHPLALPTPLSSCPSMIFELALDTTRADTTRAHYVRNTPRIHHHQWRSTKNTSLVSKWWRVSLSRIPNLICLPKCVTNINRKVTRLDKMRQQYHARLVDNAAQGHVSLFIEIETWKFY